MRPKLTALLALLVALAGCSGVPPPVSIGAEDVRVSPGNTVAVTVEASNVVSVYVGEIYRDSGAGATELSLDVRNASARPNADISAWEEEMELEWDERQDSVSATVPVRVSPDASPGNYTLDVSGYNTSEHAFHGRGPSDTVTVRVVD